MNDNERQKDADRRLEAALGRLERTTDEMTLSAGNFRLELDRLGRTLRFIRHVVVVVVVVSLALATVFVTLGVTTLV